MTTAQPEMVSGRLRRPRKSAADRILEAAFRRFQRGGLGAVSIRGIAGELGVTPMAIYRHFRDKDALLEALIQRGLGRFELGYLAVADRPGRPIARVQAQALAYVDFALTEPRLFWLLFIEHRPSSDAFLADYKAHGSATLDRFRAAVADAIANGDLAPDKSLDVAVDLWAHVHGLCALYLAGRLGRGEALFRRFASQSLTRRLRRDR